MQMTVCPICSIMVNAEICEIMSEIRMRYVGENSIMTKTWATLVTE